MHRAMWITPEQTSSSPIRARRSVGGSGGGYVLGVGLKKGFVVILARLNWLRRTWRAETRFFSTNQER